MAAPASPGYGAQVCGPGGRAPAWLQDSRQRPPARTWALALGQESHPRPPRSEAPGVSAGSPQILAWGRSHIPVPGSSPGPALPVTGMWEVCPVSLSSVPWRSLSHAWPSAQWMDFGVFMPFPKAKCAPPGELSRRAWTGRSLARAQRPSWPRPLSAPARPPPRPLHTTEREPQVGWGRRWHCGV